MSTTKPYNFTDAIAFVNDLVNGRRPEVSYVRGGSDPYTCLIDQIATMFRRGNVVDYPGLYAVMTSDKKVAVASTDQKQFADTITIDTSRQSLSLNGMQEIASFHRWLKERGLEERVGLSGFSWDQRLPRNGVMGQEIDARDAHVILPGGLFTLRSALKLVQAAAELPPGQKPSPIYLVNPSIKRNRDGYRWYFWDGLHDALVALMHGPDEAAKERRPGERDWSALTRTLEALDVHVVPSLEECKERLGRQFGITRPLRKVPETDIPEFIPSHYQMKPGSTVFFATTSPDKLVDLRKMLAPYNVRVARLDMLTPCNSPLEKSGTYTGNCSEKMREAIKAVEELRHTRPHEYKRRLEALKVKPDDAFILVEDSGLHSVDTRIYDHLDKRGFEHATKEHLDAHSRNIPGPEFGPATIGSLGEKAFWENINSAIASAEKAEQSSAQAQNRKPRAINRKVIQTSVLGLAPLEQPRHIKLTDPKSYDFQIFSGIADMKILPTPQPPQDKVIHTSHYLAPDSRINNPKGESQIELDAKDDFYILKLSSRAKAVEGMLLACHTPKRERAAAQKATKDYTVAVHGELDAHTQAAEKLAQRHGYQLELMPGGAAGLYDSVEASLARSDATLLASFMPEKANDTFVERLFTLFSHLVARQIHPRDRDKPLIVLNPKDRDGKGCWDGLLAYYDELREIGMVKDQNRVLMQEKGSLKETQALLDLSRNSLMRAPDEESTARPVLDDELLRTDRFNVAVFCAATHKNQKLLDLAHATGRDLAGGNYGIVYGAGNRSMMGEVLFGALGVSNWKELREKKDDILARGTKPFFATSSTDAILKVEADDAHELRDVLSALGQYRHAGDIYERMEYMIKQSDSFLILPGGAGTVQELAALLMLKQSGHRDMQGKEIVVVDMPYQQVNEGTKTGDRGFFSGLLEQIPNKEKFGIHVVKSQEEAMAYLAELRKKPRVRPTASSAPKVPETRVYDLSLAQAQALEAGSIKTATRY